MYRKGASFSDPVIKSCEASNWREVGSGTQRKDITMPQLKPEYQPGGAKRQHILDKAVKYLKDKQLFASQAERHAFCTTELMMTETEYLDALNKASDGEFLKTVLGD